MYKFTCTLCNKAYVGQTARPFYFRYREHKYSLCKMDRGSALSEHIITDHSNITNMSIESFKLEFLEVFRSPIECKLGEAMWIRTLKPNLNRRQELTHW